MSVRIGHILRHEDVHGVSGTGKVADVFEATNGKCVVVWISAHASVNVYDHIKDVETTHSHGGKTTIVWDYESPRDKDPMDRILNADRPELTDEEIEDIAEDAAEEVSLIAATRVAEKIAEKIAELREEKEEREEREENEIGPVTEEPTDSKHGISKKNGAKKTSEKKEKS